MAAETRNSITLLGAGGAIGSHLGPHLARLPQVSRLTLVDPDRYESKNLRSQDIVPRDVGRWKVQVQAARLRRMNPHLEIVAIPARLQDVPLGRLRASLLCACLDSRSARQAVNERAWRLGCPWLDTGVAAGGDLLLRVGGYAPRPESPCLECSWDANDYAALEQEYPCTRRDGPDATAAPTDAPSCLGAATAALAAIECSKLLDGDFDHALVGRQVLIDARHHTHFVTAVRRNPRCRFDHRTWPIEPLALGPGKITLGQVLRMAGKGAGNSGRAALRLEGFKFLRRLCCANGCPPAGEFLYVAERIPASRRVCAGCGGPLVVRGFDLRETLDASAVSRSELRRSLASLGLRRGDVFTLCGPDGDRHFEPGSGAAS